MRTRLAKIFTILIVGAMLLNAVPLLAQDVTLSERALRNALIEACYGKRVLLDLNDPAKAYVSLDEAGLDEDTANALIADAETTDGSYQALSDLLIGYCLGFDVVAAIWESATDRDTLEPVLVETGVIDVEEFFYVYEEYYYFEIWVYSYFESYSFSEEQFTAIFYAFSFSSYEEISELLIEYGVEESFVASFIAEADELIDEIEDEGWDADGDGILDVEDDDDDNDGIPDDEDTDDDGDGIDDVDEDDDADDDGIDDAEDTDDAGNEGDDAGDEGDDTDDTDEGDDAGDDDSGDDAGDEDDGGDDDDSGDDEGDE